MKFLLRFILTFLFVLYVGCGDGKQYHDKVERKIQQTSSSTLNAIISFQNEMNETFRNPESSPLMDRDRKDFEALDFFDIDTNFRVFARLVRTPEALPFLMPTNTDRNSEEVVFGIVHFNLGPKEYQLEVYQNQETMILEEYGNRLFLPFLDETNGQETYAGGRYLDLSIPEGDSLIIDFNKAYNPYCAYNKKYSCPLVPRVNSLETKIVAGVKTFQK